MYVALTKGGAKKSITTATLSESDGKLIYPALLQDIRRSELDKGALSAG